MWPALLAGTASAVIWTRGHTHGRRRAEDPLGIGAPGPATAGRIVIRATLTGASALVFLSATDDPIGVLAP